jgi:WD40 repeat protein
VCPVREINMYLATADVRTFVIQLWSAESYELKNVLKGHTKQVNSLKFSRDNENLLSSSNDHTARLWDLEGKAEVLRLTHDVAVFGACFTGCANKVATRSIDWVYIWDIKTKHVMHKIGYLRSTYYYNLDAFDDLIFAPYGTRRLGEIGIKCWNVEKGTEGEFYTGNTDLIRACVVSPLGDTVASCSDDRTARVWDLVTAKLIHVLKHDSEVSRACYSPEATKLATTTVKGALGVWCLSTGQLLHKLSQPAVLEWMVPVRSISFSPMGNAIASAVTDEKIAVFDIFTGEKLVELKDVNATCSFAYSSPMVVLL